MKHSSEIGLGQESRIEQKGERRQPELSLPNVAKHVALIRDINHKVDIIETNFYIARIRGGWLGLGGEKVRTFGSETRPSWNLSACVFGYLAFTSPREPRSPISSEVSRSV